MFSRFFAGLSTHAELVEAGGYYAELSQKQMLEEELESI